MCIYMDVMVKMIALNKGISGVELNEEELTILADAEVRAEQLRSIEDGN